MKLQEGNVIKLQNKMRVYTLVPRIFVYPIDLTPNKLTEEDVEVGVTYENDLIFREEAIDIIKEKINDSFSRMGVNMDKSIVAEFVEENVPGIQKEKFLIEEGEFVVIKTALEGGGTAHGPHDIYPDGYRVYCKALKNGKYDENGVEVSFYQTGGFKCVIKDISPIRNMKIKYV